jgi:hypothetical protein
MSGSRKGGIDMTIADDSWCKCGHHKIEHSKYNVNGEITRMGRNHTGSREDFPDNGRCRCPKFEKKETVYLERQEMKK